MGIIAKPIGYLLQLIYKMVGNYGVSLIILTVIVKLALYPLSATQIAKGFEYISRIARSLITESAPCLSVS